MRRAHLALVDDIGEDVARHLLWLGLVDLRQVIRLATGGPRLKTLGPGIKLLWRIAGLDRVVTFLQPRIDEITGDVGYRRVLAVLGEHDRRLELPDQGDELGHAKTVVPDFDDMAQRAAVELARQQLQEFAEIGAVELFGRRELPEHRAEPIAHFQHAGIVEALDGVAGFRQHAAVGGETRALHREDETIRHFARPLPNAFRLLRAVIGAVDLDRGQLRGGVGQLLRLRELLRIEHTAPRLERPAANADEDVAALCSAFLGFGHERKLAGRGDVYRHKA